MINRGCQIMECSRLFFLAECLQRSHFSSHSVHLSKSPDSNLWLSKPSPAEWDLSFPTCQTVANHWALKIIKKKKQKKQGKQSRFPKHSKNSWFLSIQATNLRLFCLSSNTDWVKHKVMICILSSMCTHNKYHSYSCRAGSLTPDGDGSTHYDTCVS